MAASRISKGRITEVVKRFKWFPLANPEKYGGSYLKNAWTEAPEVSRITKKWYFKGACITHPRTLEIN